MSFMAGFGEAFASSFENENKRQEARKQDEIDKQWETYKENLKTDKANRQNWKHAQEIVEENRLPSGAAKQVYTWIGQGYSIPQINEKLMEGDWETKRTGAEVETSYVDPRDQETQEATGQQPVGVPEPTVPASQTAETAPASPTANKRNTDFVGNIRSRIDNLPKPGQTQTPAINPARMQKRQEQAATRAGIDPTEFKRVASGEVFTPPSTGEQVRYIARNKPESVLDLADAKFNMDEANARGDTKAAARFKRMIDSQMFEIAAKASKEGAGSMHYVRDPENPGKVKLTTGELITTPDGKAVVQSIDGKTYQSVTKMPEFHERLFQKLADGNPQAVKYQQKQASMTGVVNQSGRLFELLDQHPLAATSGAGETSRILNIIDAEVAGAKDFFNRISGSPDALSQVAKWEQQFQQKIAQEGGIKTIAQAKSLANAYLDILSFSIGRAEGQEGQALSNDDAEKFKNAISGASDAETIKLLVSTYVTNKVNEINEESRVFNEFNSDIEVIKGLTGGFSPVDKIVPTFDEYIKDTENEQFYETMKNNAEEFRKRDPDLANQLGAKKKDDQAIAMPAGVRFRVDSIAELQKRVDSGEIEENEIVMTPAGPRNAPKKSQGK